MQLGVGPYVARRDVRLVQIDLDLEPIVVVIVIYRKLGVGDRHAHDGIAAPPAEQLHVERASPPDQVGQGDLVVGGATKVGSNGLEQDVPVAERGRDVELGDGGRGEEYRSCDDGSEGAGWHGDGLDEKERNNNDVRQHKEALDCYIARNMFASAINIYRPNHTEHAARLPTHFLVLTMTCRESGNSEDMGGGAMRVLFGDGYYEQVRALAWKEGRARGDGIFPIFLTKPWIDCFIRGVEGSLVVYKGSRNI